MNKQSSSAQAGIAVRQQAVLVLQDVLFEYRPLDEALNNHADKVDAKDKALLQMLCYGVMRWHLQLNAWLEQLSNRSAQSLQPPVQSLILLGLYQLHYTRIPAHAAIHATVDCAPLVKASRAKGLINAVLRQYQRSAKENSLIVNDATEHSHQAWMLEQFKQDWPDHWQEIVANNNLQAPMILRVNTRDISLEDYIQQLSAKGNNAQVHDIVETAVILEKAIDVEELPGFAEGLVSVQDAAAQLAAPLLDAQTMDSVLDACAAPGGKTAHILQQSSPKQVIAMDNSELRMQRVESLFERIHMHADIIIGDAADPTGWWDGEQYDRILLDVPCSASGVIRRHPDIKHLRSAKALQKVVKRQRRILDSIWPLLKTGGRLLYATCSVFRDENDRQVEAFLERQAEANLLPMSQPWGHGTVGKQIFPGEQSMDGFYYAILEKH